MLVEAVPNFSEGRNFEVISEITKAALIPGITKLHLDSGYDAHRTVLTIAGELPTVEEALFRLAKACTAHIDMRKHSGNHPCIGALDVCPIIPLLDTPLIECVDASKRLGERIGNELQIPVFLYRNSATRADHAHPKTMRHGGFKGLNQTISAGAHLPDYGPQHAHPSAGGVLIGARPLLIAFNINLESDSVLTAKEIAADVRTDKRIPRSTLEALGWYVHEFSRAQVSTNILDYKTTPLYLVYEVVKNHAENRGVSISGSELVGLIPLKAMQDAGSHYSKGSQGDPELIAAAIEGLGLASLRAFDPELRVIENCLKRASLLS